ncbi:hypothetical protein CR513_09815, partial [Mucuna pruriens]
MDAICCCKHLITSFLIILVSSLSTECGRPYQEASTVFIRTSCSSTSYPRLCYSSLVKHADLIQTNRVVLTGTALNVTLASTKSTSAMMSTLAKSQGLNPREVAAMKDCVEELGDSVDELRRSIDEMNHLRPSNFDDVQTWVSAALTDESTCTDGFQETDIGGADSNIKNTIRGPSASKSTTTTDSLKAYKKFIKDQCNSTTYPNVCYKSLSPYASKIKRNRVTLTKISIHVALKAAKSAYSTLTKVSKSKGKLTHGETLVIADCRENVEDTLDLLEQSADGLANLNGTSTNDEKFQWDTIKTWMSAAITDESTCTDEFQEIQVRPSLQKKIKTTVDK